MAGYGCRQRMSIDWQEGVGEPGPVYAAIKKGTGGRWEIIVFS